jgi:hypothetical protein
MNIYQSQKEYDIFCQKMAEIFHVEYKPSLLLNEELILISDNCFGELNSFYGLKHTEETKNNLSLLMKSLRKDPNSSYNTSDYKDKQSKCLSNKWKDHNSKFHKIDRKKQSEKIKKLRLDPNSVYNTKEYLNLVGLKSKERFNDKNFRSKYEKSYEITNPNGNIFIIKGLTNYCKENNLKLSMFKNMLSGVSKKDHGWKIKKLDI